MEKASRIRMDFVGKEVVKVTKSTIVAAVKLLEQNPQVTFGKPTREVIDYVAKYLYGRHKLNSITLGIVWNDKANQSKLMDSTTEFNIEYNMIDRLPISEGLPKRIAELICKTDLVVVEPISDEFK